MHGRRDKAQREPWRPTSETTSAILHRAGDCDLLYEKTVIISSLSSPKTGPPNLPSNLGADVPGTRTDAVATDAPPRRLLDQVRERVRYLHYSIRTEDA